MNFTSKGDWSKTFRFLNKNRRLDLDAILEEYGKIGVQALAEATPKKTGLTSQSWKYEIHKSYGNTKIEWTNSNMNKGVSIAIILQYGHGTGTGGYVQGWDYINPAIRPVFDGMAERIWKEVTNN